jgi:hypothetical protein
MMLDSGGQDLPEENGYDVTLEIGVIVFLLRH